MSKLLFLLLEKPKRPQFSTGQLDKLADILVGLGILVTGSVVIPAIFPGLDKPEIPLVIWGIVGALAAWIIAIFLMKGVNK